MTRDDLPEHRVAVTVFATARAVDEVDAGHAVAMAVRQAIRSANTAGPDETPTIHATFPRLGQPIAVAVHHVMEAGMAAGNGYLWTRPTTKAFPRPNDDED